MSARKTGYWKEEFEALLWSVPLLLLLGLALFALALKKIAVFVAVSAGAVAGAINVRLRKLRGA